MEETYCGKSCEACKHREAMNCPGCAQGPGNVTKGLCDLAKCCERKKYHSCNSCEDRHGCSLVHDRENMPQLHRKIKAQIAALQTKASILGKWLWILFWLIIPSTLASLLTNESITAGMPAADLIGQILGVACSVVYGLVLLRLAFEDDHYLYAGICMLASCAVSTLIIFLSSPGWALVVSIPGAIAAVAGEYNEMTAHSLALVNTDDALSDKWSALRKWYVITYLASVGSIFVLMVSMLLGLLLTLAASIGMMVLSILKLVYLYRTARAFQLMM